MPHTAQVCLQSHCGVCLWLFWLKHRVQHGKGQHRNLLELLKWFGSEITSQKYFLLFFQSFFCPHPKPCPTQNRALLEPHSFLGCQVTVYFNRSTPASSNFSPLRPQSFLMRDFVRTSNDCSQHVLPPTYCPVDVTEKINTYKLRKNRLHLKESAWLTTVTCFCTGTKNRRLTPGHQPPRQGDTLPSQTAQPRQWQL